MVVAVVAGVDIVVFVGFVVTGGVGDTVVTVEVSEVYRKTKIKSMKLNESHCQ